MATKRERVLAKLQQGDVILKKVESIPADAKAVKPSGKGFVLALGEVTGHYHAVASQEGVDCYEKDGKLYLKVESSGKLEHLKGPGVQADHNPVSINDGLWKVDIVKEYDPFDEEIRNVRD
jgi:hypothetical protein